MAEIIGLIIGLIIIYIVTRYEKNKKFKSLPGIAKVHINKNGTIELNGKITEKESFQSEIEKLEVIEEVWFHCNCENDKERDSTAYVLMTFTDKKITVKFYLEKSFKTITSIVHGDGKAEFMKPPHEK